jgi:hypothetical protein
MRSDPAAWSGSESTSPAYPDVPRSAPPAAAARRRTFFRSAAATGFIAIAFDADDGKDQDGSHAFAWSAIHG